MPNELSNLLDRINQQLIYYQRECPGDKQILERFLADAELRGLTSGTITSYRSMLGSFFRYLESEDLHFSDLDLRPLLGFLSRLREKEYSSSTIANHFSAISSLCEYMVFEGWIPSNPVKMFEKRYLRKYKKKRRGFDSGERKLISLEEMSKLINTTSDPRDKAIITLLAKTGIRREELIQIDLGDINWQKQSIRLKKHPKRTNTLIFFDDETAEIIRRYLKIRESRATDGTEALFVGKRGRLRRNGVYNIVIKHARRIGLHDPDSDKPEDHFTPHCCRHFFTTWMDRSGINREYLKELRGDIRGDAMDIYRHIDAEELRKAYLAHVPTLNIT